MTEFTQKDKLKELVKDYEHNRIEIFDMFWNYLEENADEIKERLSAEFKKDLVDIKTIKDGDKIIKR